MIPYGKHQISSADINAVVEVLENEFLTQGQRVPAFEEALCHYTGAHHAVAVNSGTSGLHVACLALGLGPGDRLWTSPNSFVASANCALYCGASVDFVDIDPVSRNMCLDTLEQKLVAAEATGDLPKVVVPVHFAGASCDMQRLAALGKAFSFKIVEDAAHGLGGTYRGSPIGSAKWSDMAVLSFHPVKSITSAEGGAILMNDKNLARKAKQFASHGITRDAAAFNQLQAFPWVYEQQMLGFNYRLSDLHAALGLSQLAKLDSFVEERRELALKYECALKPLPLALPEHDVGNASAWHLYVIELLEHDRNTVFEEMRSAGIGVNVHYIPIHCQPHYRALGFKPGCCPMAEQYYARALTLPLYPGLSADEQDSVVRVLSEAIT